LIFLAVSFPLTSHHQPIRAPLLTHSCYIPRPSHPPRLDYSNYTWRRLQITKILFQFLHPPDTSSLVSPNILLSIQFLNTLSPSSSLNVRGHVSHQYKTTGKIIVLYI
jgi:hypothetical protein